MVHNKKWDFLLSLFVIICSLLIFENIKACEIHFPEGILILSKGGPYAIESKNCTHETIQLVNHLIESTEGVISSQQLSMLYQNERILKKRVTLFNQQSENQLTIYPSNIKVLHFKTLLREQALFDQSIKISSPQRLNSDQKFLPFTSNSSLTLSCNDCLQRKSLTIKVKNDYQLDKEYSIKIHIKKLKRAYTLKNNIKAFSIISPEILEEVFLEEIPYTQVFEDLSVIHFFKTNKPLPKGSILKFSDLNGITLVKAGSKTQILMENNLLKIKTHGQARSHGSYGDYIEVKHLKNKKKYLARIIDHNKVFIDL